MIKQLPVGGDAHDATQRQTSSATQHVLHVDSVDKGQVVFIWLGEGGRYSIHAKHLRAMDLLYPFIGRVISEIEYYNGTLELGRLLV